MKLLPLLSLLTLSLTANGYFAVREHRVALALLRTASTTPTASSRTAPTSPPA